MKKCLLSGFLLVLAFPNFSFGFLAWFALVPWILSSQKATNRTQAFLGGFSGGILFFALSMSWIIHVVWFGWIFVACFEALFWGVFSLLVYEGRMIRPVFLRMFWIACSWSLLEFFRSEIPILGLPWNLLAASQTANLSILQSVNLFGAYGLGFVIALVNAGLAELILNWRITKSMARPLGFGALFLGFIFIALFAYGKKSLNAYETSGTVRTAVLQGNIAQEIKWSPEAKAKILQIYLKMTELAAGTQPDLIVWPEASFPGYLNVDPDVVQVIETVRRIKVPALIGSPHLETQAIAYNSAYLFDSEGNLSARYDKQHLVPFGEYVPFSSIFKWLQPIAYALGVSDFSAGKTPLVFRLPRVGFPFSTLICFEDVFPDLARQFVKDGARFLVVITNDAWFGESQAPYQHLQCSILRAVENGVPVVRAANTGISGMIDAKGREINRVRNEKGRDIFSFGWVTESLRISVSPTLFQRGGFIFPYLNLVFWGILLVFYWIQKRSISGQESVA